MKGDGITPDRDNRFSTAPPLSPLRYPGAKRQLAQKISRAIHRSGKRPRIFVELFAGGASVSLALLEHGLVDYVILNDKDPLVSSFWKAVFFHTNWLMDRIQKAEVTVEKWNRLRRESPSCVRERAFKGLFLNRTSFSGVLAPSAGPLGGQSQQSKYKIDCRFNKETIVQRIRHIARFKDSIKFVSGSHWRHAVSKVERMQEKGLLPAPGLFYLDPPFYHKAERLYTFYFNEADHVRLRDFLLEFSQNWILSYDYCPEVLDLYSGASFESTNVNLFYTASQNGKRDMGKEILVSNMAGFLADLRS